MADQKHRPKRKSKEIQLKKEAELILESYAWALRERAGVSHSDSSPQSKQKKKGRHSKEEV